MATLPALRSTRSYHSRRTPAAWVAVLITLALVAASCRFGTDEREPTPDRAAPATPLCGVADVASIAAPAQPPPADPVHVVARGLAVSALVAGPSRLWVLDAPARSVKSFSPDGKALGGFSVPWASAPSLAVDVEGNLYLAREPSELVKLTPSGAEVWTRRLDKPIDGVFVVGSGAELRVGAVQREVSGSLLFDRSGAPAGTSAVTGTVFSPTSDRGVLATDGNYVRRFSPEGDLRLVFGDPRKENDPAPTGGPFHFYQQGGAVTAPDGTIFVADATRGIHAASPQGYYRGMVADETLGKLSHRSWMALVGDRVYFAAGGRFNVDQTVSWVSLSDLSALVAAPKAPHHVLGFGAGLTTEAVAQYFPPGQAPAVTARFDSWWAALAPRLRLVYTVRERKQVLSSEAVPSNEVALPTTPAGLGFIPLFLPTARPGAYQVDARLMEGSRVVGATCLHYAVGAPGHRLDFATLPPGTDHGGPGPSRGVALADQLGTGALRARVQWSKLLPQGPSGPMDFSTYHDAIVAAAQDASRRGVAFWVQVGEGASIDKALVSDGSWERRVGELVAHFRGVVPAWEAWNEPNNSFGPAGAYVSQVLAPFARAVRQSDPAAKVIGGSTLGVPAEYWRDVVSAGGLELMDIASIHPYTGHNRAWEEQGSIASMQALKELLARSGAGSMPVWNTESGWWGDGPANFFSQADKVARGLLWMRILGIERWSYFILEGGFGDFGLSYSLIQAGDRPDYVKPAALAVMTASTHTAGRAFRSMLDTGIPHTFAASFGPRPGGNDTVVAVWSDDLAVTAELVAPGSRGPVRASAVDVLGASRSLELRPDQAASLQVSGSPVYLTLPQGTDLRVQPERAFGPNVAAATAGTTATASSAAPANSPEDAVDGRSDASDKAELEALPAWASAAGDATPTLTVTLGRPTEIDRVLVTTHSNGSVVPGLRDYRVEAQEEPGGPWTTVGRQRNEFFARRSLLRFIPRRAVAVRVVVTAVNFGGMAGGLRPWFWTTGTRSTSDVSHGPAVVLEVEAYRSDPGRS